MQVVYWKTTVREDKMDMRKHDRKRKEAKKK